LTPPVGDDTKLRERFAPRMKSCDSFFVGCLFCLLCNPSFGQSDPAYEPAVTAIKSVLPAVVNINTERLVRRQIRGPEDDYYEQFFDGPSRRPIEIRQRVKSLGSGFLVDANGLIVTNEHVVQRAQDLKIKVTLNDGRSFNARYVAGDSASDLALIRIEDGGALPYIDLSKLSPNLLGETVLVLGNPLGYGSSVSRGILSATDRTVTVQGTEYHNMLQTDAAINPGNSGGPLIDLSGSLVGVSSVKMAFTSQGIPTQGLGFAIPAETVRAKVEQLKLSGSSSNSRPRSSPSRSKRPPNLL
jgi:serine protease Do